MTIRCLSILAAVSVFFAPAFSQTASRPPAFDTSDVHVSTSGALLAANFPRALRGNRYDVRFATMLDLIATAYGVDADNVRGGPNWLEFDRFDISATAPVGTPPQTLNLMLQNLLADRFKLVVHHGTAPQPGFVLRMGKGANKMDVSAGGASGCQIDQIPPRAPGQLLTFHATCRNMTMQDFVLSLSRMPSDVRGPLLDQTGLNGAWDFEFQWNLKPGPAQTATAVTAQEAIGKLGLSLTAESVPGDVIIIDSVNQQPTDNLPAISRMAAPKYELAVIKLAPPGSNLRLSTENGRLELKSVTLKTMIGFAFAVTRTDGMDVPQKFTEATPFDVTARPVGEAMHATEEMMGPMLRDLLEERFALKTHIESRDIPGPSLIAGKPKLKAADPTRRANCKRTNAAEPNSQGIRPSTVTCQNVTLTQFATQLQQLSGNRFGAPVLDETGLQGTWDFSVTFVPFFGPAKVAPAAAPVEGQASDPLGATLDIALSEQLGLKVEMRKRKMQVVVVDSVNEMPTEN